MRISDWSSYVCSSDLAIGPGGYLATYRKVHLWDNENEFFEPGNLGFPIIETPLGKLGMFNCYDTWFAECYRLCLLQGAAIIDRTSVGEGKSGSVRVDIGGRRSMKKNKKLNKKE